jgi:CRISPR-associated protein Csb1
MPLSLSQLRSACRDSAAVRRVARLQPAGGVGDKVFPPTYEGGKYASDTRLVDGKRVPCTLLDSVQSQANRMELALLEAHRSGRISIPVVEVAFGGELADIGVITSLEAPHRLADAILRDSLLGDKPFRKTAEGQVLQTASTANATGLFGLCPTALVFGLWDSSGERGGLGTKFARALVSEIVAVDTEAGVRPSSRIDPLAIAREAAILYETGTPGDWTLDPAKAKVEGKKPKRVGKEGKPSEVNHGNVTPSLTTNGAPNHGGVTFSHARQVAVLSLAALRRLRFPDDEGRTSAARDEAARVALAALGLAAVALSSARGLDLRSRCLLVGEGPSSFETVGLDGAIESFELDADGACALLKEAVGAARAAGLPWREESVKLVPQPKLCELVQKSRAQPATEE